MLISCGDTLSCFPLVGSDGSCHYLNQVSTERETKSRKFFFCNILVALQYSTQYNVSINSFTCPILYSIFSIKKKEKNHFLVISHKAEFVIDKEHRKKRREKKRNK